MSVRAKFTVSQKVLNTGGHGNITLSAVIGGSEKSDEDNSFWKFTPAGSITLHIDNQAAFEQFSVDQEYYVDFTPCSVVTET